MVDLSQKNKLEYLEGLRGTAAIIVVLHHFVCAFYPAMVFGSVVSSHLKYETLIAATPLNIMFAGNFAVCIFFVLSGYVLSYKYFQNPNLKVLQSLALRRYFRLMIPVFGSVLIAYIFINLHLFYNIKITPFTFSYTWLNKYYNFSPSIKGMLYEGIYGTFINEGSKYNAILWTMYFEFFGSLLVFSFLALFGKFNKRYLVYICLLFIFWKTYFAGFILGLIISDKVTHKKKSQNKQNKMYILYSILFIISLFLGSFPIMDTSKTVYQYMKINRLSYEDNIIFWHTLGAFFLLISILNIKWLTEVLSGKFVIFLGKISFSVYLLHLIILFSLSSLIFNMLISHFSYNNSFMITFIISFPIIIFVAFLYMKYVDLNGIKFSRYFSNMLMANEKSK
jgi:peptidoglycan/LPS O-acetylase OafA/YrhL